MAFYIEKIIMHNRAPFEHLELNLKDKEIVLLNAYNGGGKTTILSHIADAFYELAKINYPNEFENRPNKFYRVSSSLFSVDDGNPSFVYIRFILDGTHIDYVDIRNKCTQEQYDEAINLDDKINFQKIDEWFSDNPCIKKYSSEISPENLKSIFENNLSTYFPAYRFEYPGYLNGTYQDVDFKTKLTYSGFLPNKIEMVNVIQPLTSWMMDVLLDWQVNKQIRQAMLQSGEKFEIDITPENQKIWSLLNEIINKTIINKDGGRLRLGIGKRYNPGRRISIVRDLGNEHIVTKYPSIYNISSGEMAVLSIFGEILHQADNISKFNDVSGIVLIDEIDKHLHIKMQKELLSDLIGFFPNVQFIISSHSPFTAMGLSATQQQRTEMYILSKDGATNAQLIENPLYEEVYELMISENERYAEECKRLNNVIKASTKPLIITEGKTDWMHLKAALAALNITDIDVDFDEFEGSRGEKRLKNYIKSLPMTTQPRKVIGIFDHDVDTTVRDFENDEHPYCDLGNNVFAFCIPIANESVYGPHTSIEHYYKRSDLLKEYEGRRLFLGEEFYKTSGFSKDKNFHTTIKNINSKCNVNGIIDEHVYKIDDLQEQRSVALSKAKFAENIYYRTQFAEGIDFSEFNKIFDIIREIQEL